MSIFVPIANMFEWQRGAIDVLSDPPGNPSKGDRYVISVSPTGSWSGQSNKITYFDGSIWQFIVPFVGMVIYIDHYKYHVKYTEDYIWIPYIGSTDKFFIEESTSTTVTLTKSDCGKTFTTNDSVERIYYLPDGNNPNNIGVWYRFVKLSATASVTIEADVNDRIADSGFGDTVYNSTAEYFATMSLLLVKVNQWVMIEGHGTWTTTD